MYVYGIFSTVSIALFTYVHSSKSLIRNLCYYTVAAHEGYNTIIAHPGEYVELPCNLVRAENAQNIGWLIDHTGPYRVNTLLNGVLDGYSSHHRTNSIIILNIMMNDSRNGTEYQCVSRSYIYYNYYDYFVIEQYSDIIFLLYVAGEFHHTYVCVYACYIICIILLVILSVLLADRYVCCQHKDS